MDSDQVNYLVWRYLQESGFDRTALVFHSEAQTDKHAEKWDSRVQVGALVGMLQKGLQYRTAEARIQSDGADATKFNLIGPIENGVCDDDMTAEAAHPPPHSGRLEEMAALAAISSKMPEAMVVDAPAVEGSNHEPGEELRVAIVDTERPPFWCSFSQKDAMANMFCGSNAKDLTLVTNKGSEAGALTFTTQRIDVGDIDSVITAFRWNNSGDFMAVGLQSGQIVLSDLFGAHTKVFETLDRAPPLHLAWSDDSTLLACALPNGMVVYSLQTLEPVQRFEDVEVSVFWCDFVQVTNTEASGLQPALLFAGEMGVNMSLLPDYEEYVWYSPHRCSELSCALWNAKASIGVSIGTTKSVYAFNKKSKHIIHPEDVGSAPTSIAWLQPDSTELIVTCASGSVYAYLLETAPDDTLAHTLKFRSQECTGGVVCSAVRPDGNAIACGLQNGAVCLLSGKDGSALWTWSPPDSSGGNTTVRSLSWNSDGTLLAVSRSDSPLVVLSPL